MINADQERELMRDLWCPAISDDLLNFVRYVYPWNVPGTPLAGIKGPRKWQAEDLDEISQHIKDNKGRIALDTLPEMFRKSTVSGRGPGKSALVSWLVHWFMSTRIGSTTIVTANTEPQLKTKTWAELGRWHTMAINAHWFDRSALAYKPMPWFEAAVKRDLKIDTGYYYAQAQLWSEENPDAFAGAHNPHGILLLMDEASGIPKKIWSVSEGFFTEPVADRYWLVFSNGRRNSGAFYDCFHADAAFWRRRQLDSRTVENLDPKTYQHIIDKYGPDSDEARIEVYGEFPNQSDMQFIPNDLVQRAVQRDTIPDDGAPLIMGVDIARMGKDSTVIRFRKGRDARTIRPVKLQKMDNVEVADEIARLIDRYNPDAINIDAGNGVGVIDTLRHRRYRVNEIWFGGKSSTPEWDDKGTEMWAEMRDWLSGGCLDNDPAVIRDLISREKRRVGKALDRIRLESKDDLRDRGLPSPDDGDALALTFAVKVARRDLRSRRQRGSRGGIAEGVEQNRFGE